MPQNAVESGSASLGSGSWAPLAAISQTCFRYFRIAQSEKTNMPTYPPKDCSLMYGGALAVHDWGSYPTMLDPIRITFQYRKKNQHEKSWSCGRK